MDGSRDVKFGIHIEYWDRLAPNGTNQGLLKISFSTFWLGEPKCTETDLKSHRFVPFGGQSDLVKMPNLTSLMVEDRWVKYAQISLMETINQQ